MELRHVRIFLILLLCQPLTLSRDAYPVDGTDDGMDLVLEEFNAILEEALVTWRIPGFAVAVVSGNDIVFLKGFGVREAGKQARVNTHTLFRLASVSKGFASTLAGILVDEGILGWDDKAAWYLPGLSLKDSTHTASLSLRHILSHTSGLMPHAYTDMIEAGAPYERLVRELDQVSIIGQPGSCYGYQNVVFSLIGDIIEAVTGETYEDLLEERIFTPLGMADANLGWEAYASSPNRVCPHVRRGWDYSPTRDRKAFYSVPPAAGVNASIADMALWLRAQMGAQPGVIHPGILEEIQRPHIRTRQELRRFRWRGRVKDAHYGLGWRIFKYGSHTVIHHSGGIRGYMAEMSFIPQRKIGIAILFNAQPFEFISPIFFDIALGLDE